MSTSSLTTLGTTLAATCSTEPAGSAGRRNRGGDTANARRAGRAVGLRKQRHSAADAGRDHRDCQCPSSQSTCARTLLGSAPEARRPGLAAPRGTDRRVRGTAAESAASHSASRTAAGVRTRPLRSGVSGRRRAHRRRAAGPAAGAAASTSGGSSCRCGALPQVGSDIQNNDGCMPTVPIWAENPLREPFGRYPIFPFPPLRRAASRSAIVGAEAALRPRQRARVGMGRPGSTTWIEVPGG